MSRLFLNGHHFNTWKIPCEYSLKVKLHVADVMRFYFQGIFRVLKGRPSRSNFDIM